MLFWGIEQSLCYASPNVRTKPKLDVQMGLIMSSQSLFTYSSTVKSFALLCLVGMLSLTGCSPSEAEIRRQNAEASVTEAKAAQILAETRDKQTTESTINSKIVVNEAITRTKIIVNSALGFGFAIIVLGLAVSAAICLYNFTVGFSERTRNQLISVHPNERGIYPLQMKQGRDPSGNPFMIVHDPNRQVGATTIYHLEAGQSPKQVNPPASEQASVEITANAQRQAVLANMALHQPRTITPQDIILANPAPPQVTPALPEARQSTLDASHIERLLAEVMEDEE